jgi:hypothetical protein
MSAEASAAAAAGAPIARRGVLLSVLLFLLLLAMAFPGPLVFLASGLTLRAPADVLRCFREGGWGMWAILFFQALAWSVIALVGALLIRGTRVPGAILCVAALAPFGAGTLGAVVGERHVSDAIHGGGVDAEQQARILAEGISELANVHVFGGLAAAFALYLAGVAAVLGVVTVDPAPLGPPPRGTAGIAVPVALAFAVASVVARVALHTGFLVCDGLVVVGIASAGLLAAAGSKPLSALCAAGKDEEAGRAFRLLLLAALTLAAAMALTDRALLAASNRAALGAIASEGVDVSQRFVLAQRLVPLQRGRVALMALDALGCLCAFAAPLAAGRGARGKVSVAGVIAAVLAALLCFAALTAGSRLDRDVAAQRALFAQTEAAIGARSITLPPAHDGAGAQALAGKAVILVDRDGAVVDERTPAPAGEEGPSSVVVAADAALSFERFMGKAGVALLGAGHPWARVGFVAAPAPRLDVASLGSFAGLVGTDLLEIRVTLHRKLADGLPPQTVAPPWREHQDSPPEAALAVLPDGDTGRLVLAGGAATTYKLAGTMPLGDGADDERRQLLAEVHREHAEIGAILLAPAPSDTIARVAAQIQALRRSLRDPTEEVVLTADRAALEVAPTREAAQASRNPAAVLAGMQSGFRRCYTKGLVEDPEMKGNARLTVKVGADGAVRSVSTTQKGLTSAVIACLETRVRAARFAPPKGGATTYVIPITFTSQ